ncbi:MAG: response regulator [Granulosicoccus sp.]|nr:response regulator [Granulosicoccus sp.]
MSSQLVIILDDNAEFLESTAFLLEAMGYEVKHFIDCNEALADMADVPKEHPACLLLDIRMPEMSGLDVHDLMHERMIDLPVIYMTAHGDVPLAVSAMRKGALTFLEKPLEEDDLQKALKQAFSDEVQSSRTSAEELEEKKEIRQRLESLTPREAQVTRCIVNELSNKQTARELHISVKTVELHRSRAMQKLQAKNAAHLVRLVLSCESN